MKSEAAWPWLRQGGSDLRTAKLLFRHITSIGTQHTATARDSLRREDAGCHIAAMCAQTIEKCIKGYMLLNGAEPKLDHRPDKYLSQLLVRRKGVINPLLHHASHQPSLSKIFEPPTRTVIKELLDLTPGGRDNKNDLPNTEYPWTENQNWRWSPCGAAVFAARKDWERWLRTATKVHDGLLGLFEAVQRKGSSRL